jgi:uncharacterized protein YndB with AHSA1/START domain
MQTLHYTADIKAPREKVWHAMLDDESYREWTKPFMEGSYFKGDWSKGSKMLFLGPNPETGQEGGMVSEIAENRPNEFVSIRHIGIIHNGVEDTTSDEAKKWAPAFENYTFLEKDGGTQVQVDVDVAEELKDEMEQAWPQALQSLKQIAES